MIDKSASQKKLVIISRVAAFCVGAVAFVLAITAEETVYAFVLYAWAGLGASFGPALLLTLWWKGITRWGVLAGIITGTVTVVLWKSVLDLSGTLYEIIPGFAVAFLSVVLVSLITRRD